MRKPLEDVRVIAVEQYGAGPFGSQFLADLGADVIKIEDPRTGGDIGRYVPPFQQDADSLFFQTFNRGKRSLSLDIANPAGREVLRDLVRRSDAIYSNLRGDVPQRLGITYPQLREVNPRIVCCSLSGFGMTGPLSRDPAYDYVLQGIAGWMSLTGEPDGPPAKSGLSMVDYSGGLLAALTLVAAVHGARREGQGMDCDLSLYDTAISLLTYVATWQLTGQFDARRTPRSAHPSLVPFQNFETADGWIVVACAKEKFWARMARVIGRPDLAEDPRFRTFADRRANAAAVLEEISGAMVQRTTAEWLREFRAAGVPCGPINTVEQALAEPHTKARNMVVTFDAGDLGEMRAVASPIMLDGQRAEPVRAPARSESAGAICADLLGYSPDRVAELAAAGAFGPETEARPENPPAG